VQLNGVLDNSRRSDSELENIAMIRMLAVLLLQIGIFSPGAFVPQHASSVFTIPPSSICKSDLGGGSVNTISCTVTAVSGSLIVVPYWLNTTSAGTLTIADTKLNSFSLAVGTTSGETYGLYSATANSSGSDLVTLTWTGTATTYNVLAPSNYSGVTSPTLDGTQAYTNSSGGATTFSTANLVTSVSGDLLVMFCSSGQLNPTAGSGWTMEELGTNNGFGYEDQVAGAAGSHTATMTVGSATTFYCVSAAFKP
jgi:hypothetical protein